MLKLVALFISAIPDLIRLLVLLQKKVDEAETERKVKDDLKTIHEAFENGDAQKLNDLFSSRG